jgi:hypothetical protein
MEQNRYRPTSPYSSASEYNALIPPNPVSRTASASSSFGGASIDSSTDTAARGSFELGRRERFVNDLSPVLAQTMSMDDDSEVIRSLSPVFAARLEMPLDDELNDDTELFEANDVSAIHAILNVMEENEENLTTSNRCEVDEGAATNSIFR